ncbi:MAG TPA: type VI secretion system protein IglI family protein [Polyangiaceae bacterium]|nr:type VI secretion system protein IglI family protein [Polyangiaceae bacterium]
MAIELRVLCEPLSSPTQLPEDLDESLDKIDRLAEKQEFTDAARAVAELCEQGLFDIRPLAYWLYEEFRERGFAGLADVFRALENLLGPSLAVLGPERRKSEFINRRLTWLFETIAANLEYHEKFSTPEWESLRAGYSEEMQDLLQQSGARIGQLLSSQPEPAPLDAGRALAQLLSRIRLEPKNEPANVETPMGAASAGPSPGNTSVEAKLAGPTAGVADRMELPVAPPFVALCRKLQAFELLVQKQDWRKAAVLSDDIAASLEHFDPLVHFPALFAPYVALLSKHAQRLYDLEQERQTPTWRALARHARVDLDSFVDT